MTPAEWEVDDTTDVNYDLFLDEERETGSLVRTGWFRNGPGQIDVGDYSTLSLADAEGIALFRNAMPEIIAVLRAAETVTERPGVYDAGGSAWWHAHDDLGAALAALESKVAG